MERQGSFQLLRSFLGSIAGGLSSLASLPFGKRKTPESPLLIQPPSSSPPPPPPFAGFHHDGDNLSNLYPDMELSESRKRARLSLDGVLGEKGEGSNEKQTMFNDVATGLGEPSGEGSGETSDLCVNPCPLDEVPNGVGAGLDDCDVSAYGSVVSQDGNMIIETYDHFDDVTHGVPSVENVTLHTPYHFDSALHGGNDMSDEKLESGHEEILHEVRDNSDDNLASFRRTLVVRKKKQKKRVQETVKEEETPRKRVRFGSTELGLSNDAQSSLTTSAHGTDMLLKKCSSSTKRKRADEAEDKNEKKLRALTLSEESLCMEGNTSTVGMVGVSTRKRERAEDESVRIKSVDEDWRPLKAVVVQNLPLNASRKAIGKEFSQFGAMESLQLRSVFFRNEKSRRKPTSRGEISETPNSQVAHIIYKDELSAKAALTHNMKEFNGNLLRVIAACVHGASKGMASADLDDTPSVFVRNTPIDVKDEELFQLFGSGGSLKLDVKAVRVTRDPNTGFSKGTAHVFFESEAGINSLLSSRRTLKLRGRVLHISRASRKMQVEQKLTPSRLPKRSLTSDTGESVLHEKQVKLSPPHEVSTISKEVEQQERQSNTRSKKGKLESPKVVEHEERQTNTRSKKSKLESPKEIEHEERQTNSRSKKSKLESPKEHIGVYVSSFSHVYTTRHVAASAAQSKNVEDSPEAKRKRDENRQRGISRSKMIRRT